MRRWRAGAVRHASANGLLRDQTFSQRLMNWRPVWGNYWVLALGPDYDYAVVGEPGRRYGWILARTPTLPDATRAQINRQLRDSAISQNCSRIPCTARVTDQRCRGQVLHSHIAH